MGTLRADLEAELDRRRAPDLLAEIDHVRQELARARREAEELRGRIPFWDRVVFFKDTPDEARLGEVEERSEELEAELERLRGELEQALDLVAEAYPPFALARAVERVQRRVSGLEVEGWVFKDVDGEGELAEEVDALGAQVLELYAPDLDLDRLLETLADVDACRQSAEDAPASFDEHGRLGWEPASGAQVIRAAAARLLKGDFAAMRGRAGELEQERTRLEAELAETKEGISLWDTINIFTVTPAEARRNELEAELEQVGRELRQAHEGALSAFPPLTLYVKTLELLGAAASLSPGSESALVEGGEVVSRSYVAGRPLVLAGLYGLLDGLRQAFGGVPLPPSLADRLAPPEGAKGSPLDSLRESFQERFELGDGPVYTQRLLEHAAMIGALAERLERVQARISVWDRLVFFIDSVPEQLEDQLQERRAWHLGEAKRAWEALMEAASQAGSGLAPFAVRDAFIAADEAIDAIHTDGGSSSFPKSCSVYGRGAALSALERLERALAGFYGLRGTRDGLVDEVADHPPVEGTSPVRGLFEPLTHAELVRRLAQRFGKTGLSGRVQKLRALQSERRDVRQDERQVSKQISFWDKVNIFTTTPAEAERKALLKELGSLDESVAVEAGQIDQRFDAALAELYPPALVYYAIGGVTHAVRSITAVCVSYTVTTGGGDNKRTETRYRCELRGKGTAQSSARHLGERIVRAFGVLPGYHELLEQAERTRLAALGRVAPRVEGDDAVE
jgi:hypothetical protein